MAPVLHHSACTLPPGCLEGQPLNRKPRLRLHQHGVIRATVPTADGAGEKRRRYFVKTSADGQAAEEMFRGEYESLNAIADSVPGFCPRALAWGPLEAQDSKGKSKGFFLATEFLELGAGASAGGRRTGESLAQRLGKRGSGPRSDVLRDTKQPNRWRDSWAEFYAQERLLTVLETSEKRNGKDAGLREMVERTVGQWEGEGITPVVVHGICGVECGPGADVGSGRKEDEGCLGGFGSAFFEAYHRIVPKTRAGLYEL
ncbi:uncharacterized protein P174DRAFT_516629 [Aspergillus novofumigatus IBT 16806]|uniref:protein-ribulosamine 3-kinase n=1 Tax=Aspergillus novofumigatus (strain IBT 16806) TaxID=1392255 RepID=A0A2I1BS90_ASPN1|nr:uncharacterized protein P174DRAFT_516629 [Aspergillus novofumigatus IBT 16806]PKX88222.1 hypothetical protein P174DRAFT_516629 [Aspergillus novofumigatus IBT 16806]